MGKPGPKNTVIDWVMVDNMCKIQCTGEEIAGVLGIDYDTLQRACKREHKKQFADYIGEKKKAGGASLRRMQWKAAEEGVPTMLIWLGKQYLGQKDQQAIESSQTIEFKTNYMKEVQDKLNESWEE